MTTKNKTAAKKSPKRKRYSPEEKREVMEFVLAHDKDHGRGGQAAAAKKFKISPITVSSWMKNPLPEKSRGPVKPEPEKKKKSPSARSTFLKNFDLRMEQYERDHCTTEVAFAEQVGYCDFCTKSNKDLRVLVVTSRRKKPKTQIKLCRSCASIISVDRLKV